MLDEHIEAEREEIAQLDEANAAEEEGEGEEGGQEDGEGDEEEVAEGEEGEEGEEQEATGPYKPNTKYKVLDQEHEFDPKLKKLLTKETEPIIRELYEKAHGIESIKASRTQAISERDEIQGNYNNLVGEVARVLNYRKAGDLQSFFESVQLTDDEIANYILEKARIAQLPPEQRAVYNEREQFRRRMNSLEQNFQNYQTQTSNTEVTQRLQSLDSVLGDVEMKRTVDAFDARNGKGAFKTAVLNYGAQHFASTQKDLSVDEAVKGFMKTFGVQVVKGQPKPGPNATKRVVARPKVKTIPNYGGGQASVTATKKPRSVEDLRKLSRGESL